MNRLHRQKFGYGGALLLAVLLLWGGDAPAMDDYVIHAGKIKATRKLEKTSAEGRLQLIRRAISKKEYRIAQREATAWIKAYPDHPRMAEAYLLRGDAKLARGYIYLSLYDYEKITREYHDTEYFHEALEAEYKIADLFGTQGKKRIMWGMRWVDATDEAIKIWILIQQRVPESRLGEKASLALAQHFARHSDIENTVVAYEMFLVNYPKSQYRELAMLELIKTHLSRFKGPKFDQSGLIEALARLKDYRLAFPASRALLGAEWGIRERLALKMLADARWYDKRGKAVSAVYMYQRLIKDYSDTPAAKLAIKRLKQMGKPIAQTPAQGQPKANPKQAKPVKQPTTNPPVKAAHPAHSGGAH